MTEVRFDSAAFLDEVRPYLAQVPDSVVISRLRETAIDVFGKLAIFRENAAPSGDGDGRWRGANEGYQFARALYVQSADGGDVYRLTEEPSVFPVADPEGVVFYTPEYDQNNAGGSAAARGTVQGGLDAEGKVLVYAVTLKADATGVREDVFNVYRSGVLRYGALVRLTAHLDMNRKHEDYDAKYYLHMREAMNPQGLSPLGRGARRRPAIAPPYGGRRGGRYRSGRGVW